MRQFVPTRKLEPGEVDYHMIDVYVVKCSSESFRIYMDMYHCDEKLTGSAPPGFTVKGQKE